MREPLGPFVGDRSRAARFTILQHRVGSRFSRAADFDDDAKPQVAAGPVHWDWLFSPIDAPTGSEEKLWTWATDPLDPNLFRNDSPGKTQAKSVVVRTPAIRLPDHRHVYLDYQGDLTRQRGTVQQVVTGHYVPRLPIGASPGTFDVWLFAEGITDARGAYRVRLRSDQCAEASVPNSSLWTLRLESVTAEADSSGLEATE